MKVRRDKDERMSMTRLDRVEVYKSGIVRTRWRWRYVAANGNILADSGQGYTRRVDCLRGLQTVVDGVWCQVDGRVVKAPSGRTVLLPTSVDGAHAFIVRDESVVRVEVLS